MRPRNFCFTKNNYTDEDIVKIREYDYKYLIYGLEIGEEKGTPHLQGYCELRNPTSLTKLQPIFGHIEARRGTANEAADYCKKSGNFYEDGEISKQGSRNDLNTIVEKIRNKIPITEIATEHPIEFIKFHRGIEKLNEMNYTDRNTAPKVYWFWGLAGTGKTKLAHEMSKDPYIKDGTMWWNGYTQQDTIIIDDFDGKWPFRDLLRLLDRYKYQGQFKGGYIKINSPQIIITCEYPPKVFWRNNELAQIERRLTEIREIKQCTEV